MEMIYDARRLNFSQSGNVIHKAITEAIHSDVQVEAFLILEKGFPPLKMISRILLKKYIKGEFLI